MASEYIVVQSFGDNSGRASKLVQALSRHAFVVVSDVGAGGADVVPRLESYAAAVVIALGDTPGQERANVGTHSGRAIPVKLTTEASLPDTLAHLDTIDLSTQLDEGPGFDELVRRLRDLVAEARRPSIGGSSGPSSGWMLAAGDKALEEPLLAIEGLERLTREVGDVALLLANDDKATKALRTTLGEIGSSYRVVQEAITDFFSAIDEKRIDIKHLARVRSGVLMDHIHNGRGHCKLIEARYWASGGPRAVLEKHVSTAQLTTADATFRKLGEADIDLFAALDQIGFMLTSEAREIYMLALAGQREAARKLFVEAMKTLVPLEAALADAMGRFRELQQSVGYAEEFTTEVARVENRTVKIYGNVSGSVIASTIEGSLVALRSASLSDEARESLDQLLKAVGPMVDSLSEEDRDGAQAEIEQLTDEFGREKPRPGVMKKCLRTLEQFGKSVGAAGLPVIQLVERIIALL